MEKGFDLFLSNRYFDPEPSDFPNLFLPQFKPRRGIEKRVRNIGKNNLIQHRDFNPGDIIGPFFNLFNCL